MRSKTFAYIASALFASEFLLCLFSWFLSVLCPECGIRSIFSGEGVRWLFGHYVDFLASSTLVWLLLVSVGYGCLYDSGIVHLFQKRNHLQYRERIGVYFIVVIAAILSCGVFILAFIPHAVLLSVTGCLFPSSFSAALVPILSFCVCLLSVVYGIVSGKYQSACDVYRSLFIGIEALAPLFLLYILIQQLYCSFRFILV